MSVRNLQLSLVHLNEVVLDYKSIIEELNEFETLPPSLYQPIFKYLIIRTTAFYEELDGFFLKIAESEEVRFQTLTQVINFIVATRNKYFPDLFNIRNNVLAHNYRVSKKRGNKSVFEISISYTFPNSPTQHIINAVLMDTVLSSIKFLYPEIYEIMYNEVQSPKENPKTPLITEKNYEAVLEEIKKEVEAILSP